MTDPQQLIDSFLGSIQRIRCLSGATVHLYRYACTSWLKFCLDKGVKDLCRAQADLFLDWIDYLTVQRRLSQRTIERNLSALRCFYDHVRAVYGYVSPILQLPAYAAEPPKEQPFLSQKQLWAMLRTCTGRDILSRRNHLIIALLWCMGLRSGELCALNWDDIDLENGILLVRKGKGNKQRQLFINERLLREMKQYRRGVLGGEKSPVFIGFSSFKPQSARQGRISQRTLIGIVRERGQAAGITTKVNPLILRHTFATHMHDAGVPINDIKEMMGHNSKSETSIYIHVTLDAMRDLFNRHGAYRYLNGEI